jgi:Spy/CpxP family protein refolding chaperone
MIWVLFIIIPTLALAQSGHSPYAGQEQRALKALSPEEIEMYLEGHGMGLAKAAELNHYPGPKHVLELAKQLNLSATQLAQTQKAYDQMLAEAVRLGKLIVAKERALDSLYATEKIDPSQLRAVVGDIAKLQGELRVTHLSAHLEMKKILSPQQVAKYDELRGYGRGTAPQQHQHGKH